MIREGTKKRRTVACARGKKSSRNFARSYAAKTALFSAKLVSLSLTRLTVRLRGSKKAENGFRGFTGGKILPLGNSVEQRAGTQPVPRVDLE